ncbi:TRAF3-interacting JNK-activating modulator isoform X2 [Kogia breviceps]|uniref:TRAF3-interacting JNK-activating modulator isoform X2 n=1 Tax=Kogia breviceps TaxID=27615 RepID=UPI0034D1545D
MISPDPKPASGLARWAESYEAKCERRQETRESRRCRPNVTTCRQAGKVLRTQQREQLQRARQQQFFRRRNLKVEEKGKAQSPQAREPGPSRRPGQATDLKDPLSWANRISSPRQQEIIQLSEYLKEALQRELVLKQKMVILQDLLSALIRASDSSWKGQLNEDKLKGKLRSLENQLYTCTQKYTPWGMNKVLLEMEEQKNSYEQKAKESLQKVLEEKISAEQQLQSTQRSLALAEQKCEEWKSQYEALKEDWRTLGTQHGELESQLHVLQSKLQGADSRVLQMNQALQLLENECQGLQAKIERLQGDKDLCSSDTQHLQDQLKRSEEEKLALVTKVQQLQSLLQNQSLQLQEQEKLLTKKDQALPGWSPKPSHNKVEPEGPGKEKDWDFRDQLQKKTLQLPAKEKERRELRSEVDNLSDEYLSCLRKLQHCREELNQSQQLPHRRQCGRWLLMLTALIAIAVAVFLANKDSLKL